MCGEEWCAEDEGGTRPGVAGVEGVALGVDRGIWEGVERV